MDEVTHLILLETIFLNFSNENLTRVLKYLSIMRPGTTIHELVVVQDSSGASIVEYSISETNIFRH
jgi:hypothetical protein